MQNVSTIEAANTVRQNAEAKGDQGMLCLLLGINMDLVASGAKYHKTCFASYVSKSNLKSQAFKDKAGQESAYDKSFLEVALELGKGLESGKAYDMSSLLKKYIGLLKKRGIYGSNYTNQKLKLPMKSHFGEMIVFHQLYQKNSPEIDYSSSISVQDIINHSAIQNKTESSTPQADDLNQLSQDPSAKLMLYRTAKSLYPVSVKNKDLATAKQIVPTDVYLFLRWVIMNDDVEADLESSCSIAADKRRVLCLAQVPIHCASHGRVKLLKHIGLVMSVYHMTESKQLVSILNQMGHCSSYDKIESVDTGLAKILAKSQDCGTVIQFNISPGAFIQFAADNNYLNEETLDGKSTTHAKTLVVYQKKPFRPMPPPKVHADHVGKERSLSRINAFDEILECSAHGKHPNVKDFIGKLRPGGAVFTTTDEYKSSCAMDLMWAVTRLSTTNLVTVEDPM